MAYGLAWERHAVVKTFAGSVSAEEFVRSASEVVASPEFESLRFIINDFRGCDGHNIDAKALEDIAIIRFGAMATNPNIRVLVVSTDKRFRELVDATRKLPLCGSQETRAFPTMEAARLWMEQQPTLDGHRHYRID